VGKCIDIALVDTLSCVAVQYMLTCNTQLNCGQFIPLFDGQQLFTKTLKCNVYNRGVL